VINYATATYYLLSREDEANNKWLFIKNYYYFAYLLY
jgi:hypothetical protein